ncbi:RNA methyltransferase, TrmH family [Novimethylophilus kurashikiensis]|uniref:RNA methyltransferase, TrmH family n=1 Tax=Novimethylophilus kurashikiensis TaxID=1825523 RepID=A0A2R5F7H0_9PROT|nr:RNA methyltransferase [Novimethylophilus kurashikiensis]GBG12853.1 RNA methyltransferase, TrmH family [Novimethylophilus kurashikiensis]
MKRISSRDNASFKQLKKLAESSKARRKAAQALLDGIHLLAACLESGMQPRLVAISENALDHPEIGPLLASLPEVEVLQLPDALFNEITQLDTPVGLLALIDIPPARIPSNAGFCLMLEDVQDPGNLGTILRSAAAAGVEVAYLSPRCADAWSPKVLRAAMGAHFVLPIEEGADLPALVARFNGKTLATRLDAKQSLYQLDLRGPTAVLIGNEGAGLSDALLEIANTPVRIPMPGQIESLNAAAAASICLFECVRQRLK